MADQVKKELRKASIDAVRKYRQGLANGVPQEELDKLKQETEKAVGNLNNHRQQMRDAREAAKTPDQKKFEAQMKDLGNSIKESAKNALSGKTASGESNVAESTKRDAVAGIKGQATGTYEDATAEMLKREADQSNKQAAQHGMEAQQHQQIGNRSEFGEGDKKAVAAQNADVKNKINVSGGNAAAGLLRMQNLNPDYNIEQERKDQQRTQAEQQREKSSAARKTGIAEQGGMQQYKIASREHNNDLDESARLSEGRGGAEDNGTGEETQTDDTASGQQQQEEQQQEEQQQQQEEQQAPSQPSMEGYDYDTVQTAYNVYAGIPDPYKDKIKRFTAERKAEIEPKVNELAGKMKSDPSVAKKYGDWLPMARGQLAGKEGPYNAGVNEVNALSQKGGKDMRTDDTQSDERVKNVRKSLSREFWDELAGYDKPPEFKLPSDIIKHQNKVFSDARCKMILESLESGGELDIKDLEFLNSLQGNKFKFNDNEYDTGDIDNWDDSVIDGYAQHIKNYLYTYKPEAQQLDPDDEQLDPEQEHIGPMAQDIEKVNPACVKETPEGVKTVDTARLAMMNAGAIGDLARELKELKAVLGGL